MRVVTLAAALLLLGTASADIITLKSGKVIRGEIVSEDDETVKIKVKVGTITMTSSVARAEIEKIEREIQPAQRAAKILADLKKDDPASFRSAIAELRELGLESEAVKLKGELEKLELQGWKERHKGQLCEVCGGDKTCQCRHCRGTGWILREGVCGKCGGTGKMDCPRCNGTGAVDCPSKCMKVPTRVDLRGIDGKIYKVTLRPGMVICMKGKGQWYKVCSTCNGTTKVPCTTCGKDRKVSCTACRGTGGATEKVPCEFCKGSGKRDCEYCRGTGLRGEK